MKVLHVIPDGRPSGVGRELSVLLENPGKPELQSRVCCLGESGLASQAWQRAGVPVDSLNRKHWFDPRPIRALAHSMRDFQPEVIHAWGLAALRAIRLASPKASAEVVVRKPFCGGNYRRRPTPLDRWLLRGADRVLASSNVETARCAAMGVSPKKLRVVPPFVRLAPFAPPGGKPLIVCAGALLPHKGYYEAIWAFDIMHYAHKDVEMAVVGAGPERDRLEQFVLSTGLKDRVYLPGETATLDQWLERASMVWVPSLKDSGVGMVLEAMAAGRPVIASRWPGLAEYVDDGQTGFLVEPGNKMELAQQSLRLLNDTELSCRMGAGARRRVEVLVAA